MNRRGFTLVEMTIVLSVIGILAGLAAPRVQDAVYRARAGALAERVAGVRLAYEAADEPSAEALRAPAGSVPSALSAALPAAFFRGEGGVTLAIAGTGNNVFLVLRSSSDAGHRVRDALHLVMQTPHIHTERSTIVPLSALAFRATAVPVLRQPEEPRPPQAVARPTAIQPKPRTDEPILAPKLPQRGDSVPTPGTAFPGSGGTGPIAVPELPRPVTQGSVPTPTGGTPNPQAVAPGVVVVPPPLRAPERPERVSESGTTTPPRPHDPSFTPGTPEYQRRIESENAAIRATMARYDSVLAEAERAALALARAEAAAQTARPYSASNDPAFVPGTPEYQQRVARERETVRLAGLRYDSLAQAAERAAVAVERAEQQAGIAPRCSPDLPPDVFRECASYGAIGWFRK